MESISKKMLTRILGVMVCLFLAHAAVASAASYYVSPSGNDANPGTVAAPWRTISYAASLASPVRAGDTVYVRAGTYTQRIEPARSGTDSAPIVFRNYPGEAPIIDGQGTHENFYLLGVGNITISGFTIRNALQSIGGDGGVTVMECGTGTTGTVTIENNHIHNNRSSFGSNPGGVVIGQCYGNVIIRNNIIHDNGGTVTMNEHGVVIFMDLGDPRFSNIVVENNEVYNQGVGIKYKHKGGPNGQFHVRYNYIHDMTSDSGIETVMDNAKIHHNIIDNTPRTGIRVGSADNGSGTEIYNNTMYRVNQGVWIMSGNPATYVHDNIFYVRTTAPFVEGTAAGVWIGTTTGYKSNYNLTFNGVAAIWGDYGSTQTLAQMQARGLELNSRVADPQFVNPGFDFHLLPTSPARNTGSTGEDVGAYQLRTEIIGTGGPPAPRPPTALRIIG